MSHACKSKDVIKVVKAPPPPPPYFLTQAYSVAFAFYDSPGVLPYFPFRVVKCTYYYRLITSLRPFDVKREVGNLSRQRYDYVTSLPNYIIYVDLTFTQPIAEGFADLWIKALCLPLSIKFLTSSLVANIGFSLLF